MCQSQSITWPTKPGFRQCTCQTFSSRANSSHTHMTLGNLKQRKKSVYLYLLCCTIFLSHTFLSSLSLSLKQRSFVLETDDTINKWHESWSTKFEKHNDPRQNQWQKKFFFPYLCTRWCLNPCHHAINYGYTGAPNKHVESKWNQTFPKIHVVS